MKGKLNQGLAWALAPFTLLLAVAGFGHPKSGVFMALLAVQIVFNVYLIAINTSNNNKKSEL